MDSAPVVATASPVVERLLRTPFATSTGQRQTLDAWRGKILVVNFWATWCPPCREEMPFLSALQTRYRDKGVQFIGISIDQADKVREFQATEKIIYLLLIGSPDAMQLSSELGNASQALPFTVIINRSGQVDWVKTGILSQTELNARLRDLVAR
jgi:thiol-disulfide isomerase/thioredoxin